MIGHIARTTMVAAGAILVPHGWAWAQQSDMSRYGYGSHMMGWGGGWFGMIFGSFFMILVLAMVIAAAVLIVRRIGGPWNGSQTTHQQARTPSEILKERFARGEIEKEEYEERRRVIGD